MGIEVLGSNTKELSGSEIRFQSTCIFISRLLSKYSFKGSVSMPVVLTEPLIVNVVYKQKKFSTSSLYCPQNKLYLQTIGTSTNIPSERRGLRDEGGAVKLCRFKGNMFLKLRYSE